MQQLAFAAADVEHACIRLHELADDGVIAAAEHFANGRMLQLHGGGAHDALATFSRYVLARKPRINSVCSATSTRNASWP